MYVRQVLFFGSNDNQKNPTGIHRRARITRKQGQRVFEKKRVGAVPQELRMAEFSKRDGMSGV